MTNIVMIVVDQLRADIAYHEHFPEVRTPHIDQLRAEGVTFHRAFCQYPVCGPSRASITTGRYPQQHGVLNNRCLLPPDERTLGQHFADLGYEVVAFGKTHGQNPGFRRVPEPTPFEKTLGSELWGFYHGQSMLSASGGTVDAPDPDMGVYPGELREHYDHVLNQQVDRYLRGRASQRPFLLWVGYHTPHPPFYPPAHLADLYPPEQIALPAVPPSEQDKPAIQRAPGKEWSKTPDDIRRQMISAYLALVTHVDECIGELLALLREQNVLDDTVVVLLSDHGEQLGEHDIIGKFNSFYEGCLRVPLIFRLPGRRCAGQERAHLAELTDVYPTLCALAGVPPPSTVSGQSLAPVLDDPAQPHRAHVNCMLVEKAAHSVAAVGEAGFVRGQMVRTERWKLAVYSDQSGELYDLQEDPGELNNLFAAPEYAELRSQLFALLAGHLLTCTRAPALWGLNHFPG